MVVIVALKLSFSNMTLFKCVNMKTAHDLFMVVIPRVFTSSLTEQRS